MKQYAAVQLCLRRKPALRRRRVFWVVGECEQASERSRARGDGPDRVPMKEGIAFTGALTVTLIRD